LGGGTFRAGGGGGGGGGGGRFAGFFDFGEEFLKEAGLVGGLGDLHALGLFGRGVVVPAVVVGAAADPFSVGVHLFGFSHMAEGDKDLAGAGHAADSVGLVEDGGGESN